MFSLILLFAHFHRLHPLFCCCTFWPYYGVFYCAFCHFLAVLGTCSIKKILNNFSKTLVELFLGHFCTFLEYFNYFLNFLGPFLVCRFLFVTIWSHFKPFQAIWSYFEPFQAIGSHLEQFGAMWSHLEPFGVILQLFF